MAQLHVLQVFGCFLFAQFKRLPNWDTPTAPVSIRTQTWWARRILISLLFPTKKIAKCKGNLSVSFCQFKTAEISQLPMTITCAGLLHAKTLASQRMGF